MSDMKPVSYTVEAYESMRSAYFEKCFELARVKERLDHLISNGVTVQKWIPVSERLPDNTEHDWVLAQVVEDNGYMHIPKVMEYRQSRDDWFEETYGWLSEHKGAFKVTHWMPLPSTEGIKND